MSKKNRPNKVRIEVKPNPNPQKTTYKASSLDDLIMQLKKSQSSQLAESTRFLQNFIDERQLLYRGINNTSDILELKTYKVEIISWIGAIDEIIERGEDPNLGQYRTLRRRYDLLLEAVNTYIECTPIQNEKSSGSKKRVNYEYSISKVFAIYEFCSGSGEVFSSGVPLHEFLSCIASANFYDLYNREGTVKSKLMYIISIVAHCVENIENSNWYKETASSIGKLPTNCSGANISEGKIPGKTWKDRANALK